MQGMHQGFRANLGIVFHDRKNKTKLSRKLGVRVSIFYLKVTIKIQKSERNDLTVRFITIFSGDFYKRVFSRGNFP